MPNDCSHVPFEAPDPARLAPLFPGYEIECLIATGGMGAVYKAVQVSLERPVAIKILPREFGRDEEFRTSFQMEARTMARLNHPNLISVYDFGEVDGMLFIIMEFVPGKTLYHSAHGTAIAQDEAARIVIGACEALAHAHEHGILHRDIKPGNILLDQQARPKIGDFGLARPIGQRHQDGETIFGTPHYTAPEVLKFPDRVDARADVFSVGVVLHELLTGRLPADDPRPASAIIGCDPKFDAVIRRATHPSADLRYVKVADMAEELRALLKSGVAAGRRVPVATPLAGAMAPVGQAAPYRTVVTAPKSGGAGVVVGLVVVAVALVAAIVIVTSGSGDGPAPAPPSEVAEVTPPEVIPRPPVPEPEVVKAPVIPDPEPEPQPEPETVSLPDPEPEPVPVVVKEEVPLPVFDVPGFLDKGREITRKRAEPALAEHTSALAKNLEAYDRRMKREIRDLPAFMKEAAETRNQDNVSRWRDNGNRMPAELPLTGDDDRWGRGAGRWGGAGQFVGKLTEVHKDFYAKQEEINRKLETSMRQIADSVYILGLTKQIERLLPDPNEVPSVKLIEAEIAAVKADIRYFIALMQGMTTEEAKAAAWKILDGPDAGDDAGDGPPAQDRDAGGDDARGADRRWGGA